jgi:hypothetical protein
MFATHTSQISALRAARRRDEVAMDAKIDGARDVARDARVDRTRGRSDADDGRRWDD